MADAEEKHILFVTGSNSDYTDKEGNDKQLLTDLTKAVQGLNELYKNKIVIHPDICSADKTPELLDEVLFQARVPEDGALAPIDFDGVIGCGGKSLVLAYQTVRELGAEINEPPVPWTPAVFVPMKDTATGGASAYWSIVDVPSAAEPRPAVSLGSVTGAVSAMYDMVYREFTGALIAYGAKGEEAAEKIAGFLKRFGFDEKMIDIERIDTAGGREFKGPAKNPNAAHILVYDPTAVDCYDTSGFFEDPAFTILVGEKKHVPDVRRHFEVLDRCGRANPWVSVGVGNYDAAATLAAHLIRDEGIEEKIRAYKAENGQKNVIGPRERLHERFPEGIR